MTSRVPGSSPGGSGVFSLFRQFTSPTDPLIIIIIIIIMGVALLVLCLYYAASRVI